MAVPLLEMVKTIANFHHVILKWMISKIIILCGSKKIQHTTSLILPGDAIVQKKHEKKYQSPLDTVK